MRLAESFLLGPPNRPTKDVSGLLPAALQFLRIVGAVVRRVNPTRARDARPGTFLAFGKGVVTKGRSRAVMTSGLRISVLN